MSTPKSQSPEPPAKSPTGAGALTVFVTGASGFVGGHVVRALNAAGHRVLAMARSERSASAARALDAEPVMTALGAVEPAHLSGVDVIVHCAAFVEEWGTREQFETTNVAGTQQLLDVAAQAGVARFIHIGTEAALFDGAPLVDVDETAPYPERHRFLYSETKAEAERRVLAANTGTFTTLSLRPRFVWGPGDTSVLPALRRMAEDGSFAWLDNGRHQTSTTFVGNLAHAVVLALHSGRGGEAYFIADAERNTLKAFMSRLAGAAGVTLPERSIPGWFARGAAAAIEGVWRLFRIRRTPPLTRFAASMLSAEVTVRWDKARKELGYEPVFSIAQGLQRL